MKRLPSVLAALAATILAAGCATQATSHAPMTRAARSTFQPFRTESGEARFVVTNIYFATESAQQTKPYFDAWTQEWLKEYDYCRKGYEVLWVRNEPFQAEPTAGGRQLTMARCR